MDCFLFLVSWQDGCLVPVGAVLDSSRWMSLSLAPHQTTTAATWSGSLNGKRVWDSLALSAVYQPMALWPTNLSMALSPTPLLPAQWAAVYTVLTWGPFRDLNQNISIISWLSLPGSSSQMLSAGEIFWKAEEFASYFTNATRHWFLSFFFSDKTKTNVLMRWWNTLQYVCISSSLTRCMLGFYTAVWLFLFAVFSFVRILFRNHWSFSQTMILIVLVFKTSWVSEQMY